jgi:hypothetical protein
MAGGKIFSRFSRLGELPIARGKQRLRCRFSRTKCGVKSDESALPAFDNFSEGGFADP